VGGTEGGRSQLLWWYIKGYVQFIEPYEYEVRLQQASTQTNISR